MRELSHLALPAAHIELFFKRYDDDRDGKIGMAELFQMLAPPRQVLRIGESIRDSEDGEHFKYWRRETKS